jgi:protein arginine N-methyltransferase 1
MTGVPTIVAAGGRPLAVRAAPARDHTYPLFPSMGEYPVYDDGVYDGFDVPDKRVRAYHDAIDGAAAGRVVLDIGTGRDALWAVHAARAGARHVYAIERQAHAADQARRTVAAAGLADRITIIHGLSTTVDLPEPAQVCVSEIVGNIASAEGAVAALADARERLCTPDCVWIPFRIQTWAAAVDLSAHDLAFASESLPYLEQVFGAVGHPFDVRLCLGGPVAALPVSTAAAVESIVFDHRRLPPAPETSDTAELTIDVPAAGVTGLMLWTRVAVTSRSAEIDTLTGDTRSWAPVYAPLSLGGIPTRRGDELTVTFHRAAGEDGLHPDYRLSVSGPAITSPVTWTSRHHSTDFRATDLHRRLFPLT